METTQTTGPQEATAAMFAIAQSVNALCRRSADKISDYKRQEIIEKLVAEQIRLSQLQFPTPKKEADATPRTFEPLTLEPGGYKAGVPDSTNKGF